MNYVGKLLSNFKGFYNEINSATLTGAIDIVIVQQEDGTYVTSPWHVRFGKMGVIRSRQKVVDIEINDVPVDLHMKLGEAGEAFFVQEAEDANEIPAHLATSPIPDSLELMEKGLQQLHLEEEGLQEPKDPLSVVIDPQPTNVDFRTKYYKDLVSPRMIAQVGTSSPPILADDNPQDGAHVQSDLAHEPAEPEPEVLTTRSRIFSGDSCISGETDISTTSTSKSDATATASLASGVVSLPAEIAPPETSKDECDRTPLVDHKVATFISLEESHGSKKHAPNARQLQTARDRNDVIKIRRKRQRKNRDASREKKARAAGSPAEQQAMRSGTSQRLEVGSVGSGSSGEFMEEGLFDMELSDQDEVSRMSALLTMGRTISMPLMDDRQLMTDEWANSQYASAFHPFSDGDITPVVSPVGSRPPSPKSDTEYETQQKYDSTAQAQLSVDALEPPDSYQWRWGELPESTAPRAEDGKASKSALTPQDLDKTSGGLFHFMRQTKKIRHQPEQEGIYLDDLNLNEMDPEVAQLYIYQSKGSASSNTMKVIDEDNESGRGASLPHSPLTVESGPHDLARQGPLDIAISRCGGLKNWDGALAQEKFLQYLITFEEFCANPSILQDPNLVIKWGEKFYNWQVAGPMLMSILAFQRPLPEEALDALVKQYMPKKERRSRWYWWGSRGTAVASPGDVKKDVATSVSSSPAGSPRKSKERKPRHKDSHGESSEDESDDNSVTSGDLKEGQDKERRLVRLDPNPIRVPITNDKYRKSLKLTSEEIESLRLQDGINDVTFSVTTQFQGTTACSAHIFLWKWDDRLVVSDIDGTITKSDVLGQVLPMIGKDWSQAGVADLYSRIYRNGYRFLYLSARAIGQSKTTKEYLRGVRQGALSLPEGPLLLSPSSLISAFHKEVIERKPEEFKISCLRNIQCLFPQSRNPFYAGFGNKVNDVWSYRAVSIPISRIFTVNHRGELKHDMTVTFQSTYSKLSDSVDQMFPPLLDQSTDKGRTQSGNFPAPDEFSNFTYWREPLPDIQIEVDGFLAHEKPAGKRSTSPAPNDKAKPKDKAK